MGGSTDERIEAAAALRARYWRDGSADALTEAIGLYEQVVADGDPGTDVLTELGRTLLSRASLLRRADDVDAAARVFAAALDLAAAGTPEYVSGVIMAGDAAISRWDLTANETDYGHGIARYREALALDRESKRALSGLGTALARHRATGKGAPGDADEALAYCRRALEEDDPERLMSFAFAALLVAGERHDLALLESAAQAVEAALALTPETGPERWNRSALATFMLFTKATLTGRAEHRQAAMAFAEDTLRRLPAGVRSRPLVQITYGVLCLTDPAADLERDRGIELMAEAIDALPAGNPQRAQAVGMLRQALWRRFEQTSDRADLDRVIMLLEADLAVSPADEDLRQELTAAKGARFAVTMDITDLRVDPEILDSDPFTLANALAQAGLSDPGTLDTRIAAAESMLARLAPEARGRLVLVSALTNALLARFMHRGVVADLDRAIQAAETAVDLSAPGEPVRAIQQANLARALVVRADAKDSPGDLDAATALMAEVVHAVPSGHPDRPLLDDAHALALVNRFHVRGDPADLTAAIAAYQSAVGGTPLEQPIRRVFEAGLGRALQYRFELHGDPADNQAAVAALTNVLAVVPAGNPERAEYLYALGQALVGEYGRTGDRDPLDKAITILGRAAESSPPAKLPGAISELGTALKLRAELDSAADLETAIDLGRQALLAAGTNARDRALAARGLADSLRVRSQRTGSLADADEAVAMLRDMPTDRSVGDLALAVALQQRFELTGVRADIDMAITLSRRAGSAPHFRVLAHQTLAGALWLRSRHLDDLADLDEAIATQELIVSVQHRQIISDLYNKAGMLLYRYDAYGRIADLDEAIAANRSALAAMPEGHPHRALIGNGLALLHGRRHDATGQDADLQAMIDLNEAALAATARGDALLPRLQHVRGTAWMTRSRTSQQRQDLQTAITAFEATVHATPAGHPDLGARALSLGEALLVRHQLTGRRRDLKAALAALRLSIDTASAPASTRVAAARKYGAVCVRNGRPAEALQACRLIVQDLLPMMVWRGLDRLSQENLLKQAAGLASEAIATALACEDAGSAIQLLEQARGVLWSQLLDLRTDRSQLLATHPGLAADFDRICAILDHGDQEDFGRLDPPTPSGGIGVPGYSNADQRRRAADRFTELLAQIRRLPGFTGFLRPPELGTLLTAAADGVVAILNVDRLRCDAILLTAGGLRVLPLTWLTDQEVNRRAAAYHEAMSAAGLSLTGRINATQTLLTTLEWLWESIVAPILDAAGLRDANTPQRVWWYGTGPLSALPFHAAGLHRTDGEWAGDHIISSYASTLQTLTRARSPRPSNGRLLAVGLPVTPRDSSTYGNLPAVPEELQVIRQATGGTATVLEGESATRAAVLDSIHEHARIHLACHGRQDPATPSRSHLALYDTDLTLLDLLQTASNEAESAFLSACETARGDVALADEAIHMAAAFQVAGYRHVIGTLWNVRDATAPMVAREVYAKVRTDPENLAVALHEAIRHLKQTVGPLSWAPYLHLGP